MCVIAGRKHHFKVLVLIILLICCFSALVHADISKTNIVKNVSGEGSCAIVGMSAEQSQLIALQRARTQAIEQAVDIRVTSHTVVTNFRLAADFMKTYSEGFIVNEQVEWLPLGQYQKDSSTAPIPEYRVKIVADVYRPVRKIPPLGLVAHMNDSIFKTGEKAKIEVIAGRRAQIGVFNITADDRVVMLFPNQHEPNNIISREMKIVFPSSDSPIELVMGTLPGHKKDAEAFFIVALDERSGKEISGIFSPMKPMRLTSFFHAYSEIADYSEDTIISYEVIGDTDQ